MRNLAADFDDSIEVTEYNSGLGYTFTIPASPNHRGNRYIVYLPEIPYLMDNTKLPTISGMSRVENIQPATGEFRTVDAANSDIRLAPHMVEFNSAQAGLTKTILFWSYGSIINAEDFSELRTEFEDNIQRSSTFVVASSGTTAKGIYSADYICDGTDDNVEIQAAIDATNALGGGKVVLLEGIYNITTQINMKSLVFLEGQGEGTVLKRASSSVVRVIYVGLNVSFFTMQNFYIFGNEIALTVTGDAYGIECYDITNVYDKYIGIHSGGNKGTVAGQGFYGCKNMLFCYAHNNSGGTVGRGFYGCQSVTNCISDQNWGGLGYGFVSCKKMIQNKGFGNTTATYNGCYADSGTSYATADTPNGGFNS